VMPPPGPVNELHLTGGGALVATAPARRGQGQGLALL